MSLLLLVRRLHLYTGLLVLPWVVMFGLSSLLLNHATWMPDGPDAWSTIAERPYTIDVPSGGGDLRPVARQILTDFGFDLSYGFGVYPLGSTRIVANVPGFRRPIRVTYFKDQHRALAEQRRFVPGAFLRNMHTRDGYYLEAGPQTAWGVVVDVVCGLFLFWIVSGLYLWWKLPGSRGWGMVTLVGSVACFTWLMLSL